MRRAVTPSGSLSVVRGRRLDADDQQVAVAEAQQVLRGGAGAALVVDLHARLVRQRGRVHHHERHAGGADLLDLGVARGQADRDDAVDRRPAHRAGEAAVERRDEVERVARLLGRQGDALARRPRRTGWRR